MKFLGYLLSCALLGVLFAAILNSWLALLFAGFISKVSEAVWFPSEV